MSTNYTPGPWEVFETGRFPETNHAYGIGAKGHGTYHVAKVEGFGYQSLANARLIAAAPDLLEAAKRILEGGYVSQYIEEERGDHLLLAAAIVKAEGTQL